MARLLPPPPIKEDLPNPFKEWLNKLYTFLGDTSNLILWNQINTSGSELDDITTRPHSMLQAVSGSTEQFHVSQAHYVELLRQDLVTSVAVNTSLDDTYATVHVTATGKIITLPAASSARIGKEWTVLLNVLGYTDITRAGSDTIVLPDNSTTFRLNNKGASITFRCLTATSWGIV